MQLVVGRIVSPHGIRGEVVVVVTTDEPATWFVPGSVLVTEPAGAGPLAIEAVRPHQGRLIVAFDGVLDRDGAEALRGVLLCVDSADVAPPEDPDEFHDYQLVGLAVVDPGGEPLGEVVADRARPGRRPAGAAPARRGHRAGPVREGDRAGGGPRRPAAGGRPARGAARLAIS